MTEIDMSIVDEIRSWGGSPGKVVQRAAQEIETLRARVVDLEKECAQWEAAFAVADEKWESVGSKLTAMTKERDILEFSIKQQIRFRGEALNELAACEKERDEANASANKWYIEAMQGTQLAASQAENARLREVLEEICAEAKDYERRTGFVLGGPAVDQAKAALAGEMEGRI